jgi:hypothetical protein
MVNNQKGKKYNYQYRSQISKETIRDRRDKKEAT